MRRDRCPCCTRDRRRPLSMYSQSAPPSIVVFTSALDGTLTLVAQVSLYQCYPASHGIPRRRSQSLYCVAQLRGPEVQTKGLLVGRDDSHG